MSKNKVFQVLNSPTKLQRETLMTPNGFLASLWRKILFDLRMSPAKWDEMVVLYLERTEGISRHNNSKEANYQRGKVKNALNTELFQDSMTLNTFMRGMQVLDFDVANFTVTASKYDKVLNTTVEATLNFEALMALYAAQGKMTDPTTKPKKENKKKDVEPTSEQAHDNTTD